MELKVKETQDGRLLPEESPELTYQHYIDLKRQARHYRKFYEDQLNALQIREGKIKEDTKKDWVRSIVCLILGLLCKFLYLDFRMPSLISIFISWGAWILAAVFFTVMLCSLFDFFKLRTLHNILTEASFYMGYVHRKGIVTMEAERRHCRNMIQRIDRLTERAMPVSELTDEYMKELSELSIYREVRSDADTMFQRVPETIILAVITVAFLLFYIFI